MSRVEFWWWLECRAGDLWQWGMRRRERRGLDATTVPILDWLTAWTYRRRKLAERRR